MRNVEATISINNSPGSVTRAFTNVDMLKVWWGIDRAYMDPVDGGGYTLVWGVSENGFGYVATGTVANYQPGKILRIKNYTYLNPKRPIFGSMSLIVEVKGKSDSCTVNLRQEGYQEGHDWDWYYEAVKQAWPIVLGDLKKYLESIPVI